MRSGYRAATVIAAAAFAVCASATVAAQAAGTTTYQVVDIGANVNVTGLNNKGQVVGSVPNPSSTYPFATKAALWSPATGLRVFNQLPSGFDMSAATAINDQSQIVLQYISFQKPPVFARSVIWASGSKSTNVPPVRGYTTTVIGNGINNHGDVAGAADYVPPANDIDNRAPILKLAGGTSVNIADGLGWQSNALRINDAGQVLMVDYYFDQAGYSTFQTPQLRQPNGQIVGFGLPPTGIDGQPGWSDANDLSNTGVVVGESGGRAYEWSAAAGVVFLQPDGGSGSAHGVNDLGMIVGTNEGQASLWVPGEGWIDITTLLSPTDAARLSNIALLDVNNNGQIVAQATIDGVNHAVLLNPPATATARR
jgi:hypothetical protein